MGRRKRQEEVFPVSCFILISHADTAFYCTTNALPLALTRHSVSPTHLQAEPHPGGVLGVSGAMCLGLETETDGRLQSVGRGQSGGVGGPWARLGRAAFAKRPPDLCTSLPS